MILNLIHNVRQFFGIERRVESAHDAQKPSHHSMNSELVYAELFDGVGSERFREYPWQPNLMG